MAKMKQKLDTSILVSDKNKKELGPLLNQLTEAETGQLSSILETEEKGFEKAFSKSIDEKGKQGYEKISKVFSDKRKEITKIQEKTDRAKELEKAAKLIKKLQK